MIYFSSRQVFSLVSGAGGKVPQMGLVEVERRAEIGPIIAKAPHAACTRRGRVASRRGA